MPAGDLTEFLVDDRDQFVQSLLIASLPAEKEFGNRLGSRLGHRSVVARQREVNIASGQYLSQRRDRARHSGIAVGRSYLPWGTQNLSKTILQGLTLLLAR